MEFDIFDDVSDDLTVDFDGTDQTEEKDESETSNAEDQEQSTEQGTEQSEKPEAENKTAEGKQGSQEEQNKAQEQTISIVYNGQTLQLTNQQAVQLAQKGMNYDKAVERAAQQALENPTMQFISQIGALTGESAEQTAARLFEVSKAALVQEYISKGATPEMAQAFVNDKVSKIQSERGASLQSNAKSDTQETENQRWAELVKAYPNADFKDLPQSFVQDVNSGMSPLAAYQKMLIAEYESEKQLSQQRAAQEENTKKIKEKSPGSTRGRGSEDSGGFASAFDEAFYD